MYAFNTGPSRVRAELAACKALASSRKRHAVVRVASGSFVVRSEQWDKNWGSKKSFLEVAVAAPARVELASAGRVWGIILFGILSCCAIDAEVLEIHYIIKIASYEEASESTRRRFASCSKRVLPGHAVEGSNPRRKITQI